MNPAREIEHLADKIERLAVKSLVPHARNARTHSPEQIAQIAASIREFGFTIPILIDDDGIIIAGHARVMALQSLGVEDCPAIIAHGWDDAKKRAYMLADNKLALNAGWDIDLLKVEVADIASMGFDLSLAGFTPLDIEALMGGPGAGGGAGAAAGNLSDRFGLPPFSVLNAREGWWQARKAAWIALGIQSELGRGENLLEFSDTIIAIQNGQNPRRVEATTMVAGKGWAQGGPARRDTAFYAKKRAWEAANGRTISTSEFREKYWDGAQAQG